MTDDALFRHADVSQFVLVSNEDLGAVEVATFIALVLFGISLSQGYHYYHRWSEDSMRMKILVGIILFLEAAHSFTASQTIYYDTVTRFTTAQPNSYPLSTTVLLETFITVIVQCFFSYRIFRLSENVFITATCLTLSFLRFVGGFALTIESFMDVPNNPNGILFVERLSWLITSALAVGGAADVLIAAAMLVYLRRLGSPTNLKSTTMVINRLVRWSLQTGLLTRCGTFNIFTSGIITLDKPGVSCDNHLLIWFGIYIVLAKFYANSLLVALTSRPRTSISHLQTTGRSRGHTSIIQFERPPPQISISFPTPFGSMGISRRISVASSKTSHQLQEDAND